MAEGFQVACEALRVPVEPTDFLDCPKGLCDPVEIDIEDTENAMLILFVHD